MRTIDTLDEPGIARLLLHPLRRKILEEATSGAVSASELARRLGEKRQKLNYHVQELAEADLLEPAGEIPRRGLTEKLYRASASTYALDPDVLGRLAPSPGRYRDGFSAGMLLSLAGRIQSELARSASQAERSGKRLATLSLDTEVRFTSSRQQKEFAEALTQAVADVVARYSEPVSCGRGHRYRLVAGAYPVPREVDQTAER